MTEVAERTAFGDIVFPPGTMLAYGHATPPVGWLVCDGTAVLRVRYSALFDVISTNYGTGDGLKTFNLPDMQGVSPVGVS